MVYLDADPRNADWLRIVGRAREFAAWTVDAVHAECAEAYRNYSRLVRERHISYFAARPEIRSATHAWGAARLEDVFPPGWRRLAGVLPPGAWHKHCRAGGSSQALAVTLLAAAGSSDPTASWLPTGPLGGASASLFEVELAAHVLNEQPRQTTLDLLISRRDRLIAGEAKFTERGFGTCSCGERANGRCSARIEQRPYWRIASSELGLIRQEGRCALGLAYQVVRNLAAVQALARGRRAEFLLFYDVQNPYFTGAGAWPGWVTVLEGLTQHARTTFAAVSWQRFLGTAHLDGEIIEWAAEKHGLEADRVA